MSKVIVTILYSCSIKNQADLDELTNVANRVNSRRVSGIEACVPSNAEHPAHPFMLTASGDSLDSAMAQLYQGFGYVHQALVSGTVNPVAHTINVCCPENISESDVNAAIERQVPGVMVFYKPQAVPVLAYAKGG